MGGQRLVGRRGFTVLDTLLVCILISGLTVAFMDYYQRAIREARETALKTGLENIRLSMALFSSVNGRFPDDLRELLSTRFIVPTREGTIFTDQYLMGQAIDAEGYPTDPFDTRYRYDRAAGTVRSGTEGYERW